MIMIIGIAAYILIWWWVMGISESWDNERRGK